MRISTIVTAAGMLACASIALAEPVSLAPKAHAGQTLQYEQVQANRTTFAGQTAELNTRTRFGIVFGEAGEGPTPATMTIGRLVVDFAQPGMRAYFDSDAPAGDGPSPLAPALGPVVGSEVTMTVTDGGEVEGVDVGAMAANQAAAMAGVTGPAIDETVTRTIAIPDAPAAVEVGDRWTWVREDSLDQGATVSVAHDMLVESVEGDLVTITFTGGASLRFAAPRADGEPPRPTLESSEISGRIVWDSAAGCAVSWDYLSSLGMTAINAEDPSQQAVVRVEYTLRVNRVDE